jgi:putative glutamine amidotransferase
VTAVRPLIGVTTSEVRMGHRTSPLPEADPPQREMALGMTYARAVERAGGLPVVLPPLETNAVGPLIERLWGVCLSGGPDLSPASYGARPHDQLGPTEPDLDLFELEVARRADALGIPVLGICRGAQTLNVARGGTLYQHLPDVTDGSIAHRQEESGRLPTHAVRLEPGSLLAGILGVSELRVNSFHHQAVEGLGRGLRAVAWSPDGVVEGIEDPRGPFFLGVQWHAETLTDAPPHDALFRALIDAARGHALGAPDTASEAAA